MSQIYFEQVSSLQFYAYNGMCIIGLTHLLRKYWGDILFCVIILSFSAGVFNDLGGNIGRNIFRICLLLFCAYKSSVSALWKFYTQNPKIFYIIFIYCLFFIIDSIFINNDNVFLVFSLLSNFLIPFFILTLMLEQQHYNEEKAKQLFWLFGDLISLQILLSIGKMIILGGFLEGWVGSITGIRGGGPGTSFPLLALMWLALKNDMKFSKKDCFLAIGLLLLGFSTGKRAIWILFPLLFLILSLGIYKHNLTKKIIIASVLLPIIFYLAVRISPTFNPDKKVWGDFDAEYAISYVMKYTGGIDENHSEVQSGVGRLGAVKWLLEQFSQDGQNIALGRGNEYITYAGFDNYSNASYYGGIKSRGSVTGVVKTFFVLGVCGAIIYIILIISLFLSKINQYNICLLLVILFDYIFYNAGILDVIPLLTFALFLSYFSPYLLQDTSIEISA